VDPGRRPGPFVIKFLAVTRKCEVKFPAKPHQSMVIFRSQSPLGFSLCQAVDLGISIFSPYNEVLRFQGPAAISAIAWGSCMQRLGSIFLGFRDGSVGRFNYNNGKVSVIGCMFTFYLQHNRQSLHTPNCLHPKALWSV
jgi:hypothetical protein